MQSLWKLKDMASWNQHNFFFTIIFLVINVSIQLAIRIGINNMNQSLLIETSDNAVKLLSMHKPMCMVLYAKS